MHLYWTLLSNISHPKILILNRRQTIKIILINQSIHNVSTIKQLQIGEHQKANKGICMSIIFNKRKNHRRSRF